MQSFFSPLEIFKTFLIIRDSNRLPISKELIQRLQLIYILYISNLTSIQEYFIFLFLNNLLSPNLITLLLKYFLFCYGLIYHIIKFLFKAYLLNRKPQLSFYSMENFSPLIIHLPFLYYICRVSIIQKLSQCIVIEIFIEYPIFKSKCSCQLHFFQDSLCHCKMSLLIGWNPILPLRLVVPVLPTRFRLEQRWTVTWEKGQVFLASNLNQELVGFIDGSNLG